MGIKAVYVELSPAQEIYFPGQQVVGYIKVDVSSPVSCRAVVAYCKGKAHVYWKERKDDKDIIRDANERYFSYEVRVWSPASGEELQAGSHSFPFTFLLPQNIPSSFEGTVGWVRYKVTAKVDLPMAIDDVTRRYFSVNCTYDLNLDPLARSPLNIHKTDTSCCLCFTKGPVSLNFTCLHSGAVIGENFKLRGEVVNSGSKPIQYTCVTITQHVKYRAEGLTRNSNDTVCKVQRGEILPGESDLYNDVPLKITAVVPGLQYCSIINLEYRISFSANYGSCSSVNDELPFYIGTIPFLVEGAFSSVPAPAPFNPNFPAPCGGPSAPPAAPDAGAPVGFGAPIGTPQPIIGQPGMLPPMIGQPVMPPPVIGPPVNIFPNQRPPGAELCYFSTAANRSRLDKYSGPPYYLTYDRIL